MSNKTRRIGGRTVPIRPEKPANKVRKCASETCSNSFVPVRSDQIYCSKACNTREAQRRLRERARIGA